MGGVEWSENELAILSRDYAAMGPALLATSLNRSLSSVKSKAKKLRLLRNNRQRYTAEEMSSIRELYPSQGASPVAAMLGRSLHEVRKKAALMGVRYDAHPADFTDAEKRTITEFYSTRGPIALAKEMSRTPESIRAKAQTMGLKRPLLYRIRQHPVTLSKEDLSYLAALIDGEGCVTLKRCAGGGRNPIPVVVIASTSRTLIDWVAARVPPENTVIAQRPGRGFAKGSRLPAMTISFRGYSQLPLYKALREKLVLKWAQMELLIEWSEIRLSLGKSETMPERSTTVRNMLRYMNLRGYGVSPEEKLQVYQSLTWEPALERMRQLGF